MVFQQSDVLNINQGKAQFQNSFSDPAKRKSLFQLLENLVSVHTTLNLKLILHMAEMC